MGREDEASLKRRKASLAPSPASRKSAGSEPEADGELTLANGRTVSEDALASLHDGSFDQPVFVSFETSHFSTFNCDAPIDIRAYRKRQGKSGQGEKSPARKHVTSVYRATRTR